MTYCPEYTQILFITFGNESCDTQLCSFNNVIMLIAILAVFNTVSYQGMYCLDGLPSLYQAKPVRMEMKTIDDPNSIIHSLLHSDKLEYHQCLVFYL